ncbi:MAG: hypothetical protein FWE97_02885, partial [Dehalococcoidia bacterium]|nr:hypothetical protein [Dehalococcoidia bacterium]
SSVSNGTSQITFYNIPASTLGNNISPMLQTVIAHEYMHAIMNTYQFIGNTPHWYNEAFASWAMIRQYGTTGSQELAGHVNNFLNSTGLPLSSFSQTWRNSEAYGAVLIPLYIHQYYGGDSTIKGILTRSASSTNVYTNITNALPGSVTFADAFGWSWAGSYAPRYTYTNSITAWNAKPNIYNYYNYMNKFAYGDGPYVVDALSSHFLEFSIVGSTVNITVELDYASSNLKCYFSLRTSAGVINTVDMTGSPSRFYTLVKSSSGYFEGCVIPVNAALSGTTSYELTVYQY